MSIPLFVTCLSGLEEVLQEELSGLGFTSQKGGGGVWVPVTAFAEVMRLNLSLRTASRVLLPLFDIESPTRERLYKGIYDSDFMPFFPEMRSLCIDVPFAKHPHFNNTHFVAQLAKDALCDRLKKEKAWRPSVDTKNPDVRFSLIVMPNKAVFYFDTSGDALFKRGYRQQSVEAPIKENLAAALLMLAGYTGEVSLVDPCCGSGTFLIEAALMATRTPPGFLRKRFGFFAHPLFQESSWEKIRNEALQNSKKEGLPELFGIEKDERTYLHLRKALSVANLNAIVKTFCGDFRTTYLPVKPSFLISNPPFGVRMGKEHELTTLYQGLGSFMKTELSRPATAAILSHSIELLRSMGVQPAKTLPISHGGLDCFFSIIKCF